MGHGADSLRLSLQAPLLLPQAVGPHGGAFGAPGPFWMEGGRKDRGGQQQREPHVRQGTKRLAASHRPHMREWGGRRCPPVLEGLMSEPVRRFLYLQKFKLLYNFEAVQACRLEIVDVDKTNKPDTVDFRKCVST